MFQVFMTDPFTGDETLVCECMERGDAERERDKRLDENPEAAVWIVNAHTLQGV